MEIKMAVTRSPFWVFLPKELVLLHHVLVFVVIHPVSVSSPIVFASVHDISEVATTITDYLDGNPIDVLGQKVMEEGSPLQDANEISNGPGCIPKILLDLIQREAAQEGVVPL